MIIAHLNERDRKLAAARIEELVSTDFLVAPIEREKLLSKVLPSVLESSQSGLHLSNSNTKLSGKVLAFSLPPGNRFRSATCPGASSLCENICYASKRGSRLEMNEWHDWLNWAFVLLWPDRFVDAMVSSPLSRVLRIHVGGDFYDQVYTGLWEKIIRENPKTRFYTYTRSWQDGRGHVSPGFVRELSALAAMPNMRLVLSCDQETGVPPLQLVPGAVRAWLGVDDGDVPPEPVELFFRNGSRGILNSVPVDSVRPDGTTVCPIERASSFKKVMGKITCANCGWCWGAAHEAYLGRPAELSRFSNWAGVDFPRRVRGMFHGFVPQGASLSGSEERRCTCGTRALCGFCGDCVECLCGCPISFGWTP